MNSTAKGAVHCGKEIIMVRPAYAALILTLTIVTGCTNPKQANYSCRPDVSAKVAPPNGTPPLTDAAGDKTCE
jgi:hypothetical protein